MTEPKSITKNQIVEYYINDALEGSNSLKSVFAFAKKYTITESDFYDHFASFEALEKSVFASFCTETIKLLLKNDDYHHYNSNTKLLSFYFTFFELLTANRSFVFLKLKSNANKLESLKLLSGLRKEFITYLSTQVYINETDLKNKSLNELRDKGVSEATWLQLLFTLQFWLEDESKGFEKTDIFIEKSVKASFDLKDITPVKSVFDFAKFLWNEKRGSV